MVAGEVNYHPDAADYVAASRAAWMRSVRRRRFVMSVAWLALFAVAVGVTIGWFDRGGFDMLGYPLMTLGLFAAWMLLCIGFGWLLLPRRARRLFRQQKSLDQDHLVTWNDAGISYRTPKAVSDLAWSDYHGWYEGRAVFLFMLNDQLHHFVLKRAMTEDQIADLRATAAPHFVR